MTSGITKKRARLGLASTSTWVALSCSLFADVGCSSNNNNSGAGGTAGTSYGGTSATGGRSKAALSRETWSPDGARTANRWLLGNLVR